MVKFDASDDSATGLIVELRAFEDAHGRQRIAIAVRSDLPIKRQVSTAGATWLDREGASPDDLRLGQCDCRHASLVRQTAR